MTDHHICPVCANIHDTQAEADACCTMQGAIIGRDEMTARDEDSAHYSDPRWDRWGTE